MVVDLVVLKYVKALFEDKNLSVMLPEIKKLALAYENKDLIRVISSYEISKNQKVELLTSLTKNKQVQNLIKLLAQKNRLLILPDIYKELEKKVNISKNIYSGVIYSKDKLNTKEVKKIEEKLSKKFNIKLNLTNKSGYYNGIKVEIEDLGVEIGLGLDLIQSQLKEFILKAV